MLKRALLMLLVGCAAALAHDISGKWTFNVETDAGSGSPTFVFKQAGEALTGTYNGTFGTADVKGTVKGNAIEFSIDVTMGDQKGTVVYKGTIETAEKMKGDVELAGLGKGTWTGSKQ
jgi:hypothetical protein